MAYCTVEDVVSMSGVNASKFGYKDDEGGFNELIEDWISQAESLINSYCNRNWYDLKGEYGETISVKVPFAVKNVCIRLVSNMVAFKYARKDNPIKKVNDFSLTIFSSEIFTESERRDLKPFRKSSKIRVFKI